MSRPVNWWWGLAPLALLWIVSHVVLDRSVAQDLSARVSAFAAASGQSPVVGVSGRDVTLAGTVFSDAERSRLVHQGATLWGVRKVTDALQLPPEAKPYDWQFRRDGDSVALAGSVPDPAARAAIRQAAEAAFPGVEIRDEATYASGAPAGFAGTVARLLPPLATLDAPSLTVSDSAVNVGGRASSPAARQSVLGGLEAAVAGFRLAAIDIAAPEPYSFTARRSAGALTLTGAVPDEDQRAQVAETAGRLFSGDRVTADGLSIAGDAPAGFSEALLAGLRGLSRLEDGSFSLTGTGAGAEASLQGQALYPGALDAIRAQFAADLPDGYVVRVEGLALRAPGPRIDGPACQSEVDILLGRATILFDTGLVSISRDSSGLLDRIAATLLRCPDNAVEIAGHTDASGDAAANLALSQQRAEAVLAYLADAGLARATLTARGYGSANPVADNDTEEGRARNRRIEFTLQ